jgi:hypothetical protein
MKRVVFILMVWLLAATAPSFLFSDPPYWIWRLYPDDGHPQFSAFCPKLLQRENELPKCLENAAIQASKYKALSVNAGAFYQKRSFLSRYLRTMTISFDEDLARKLVSDLVIVKEYRNESGTYVVVKLLTETINIPLCNAMSNQDHDAWKEGTVEIDGYYTAIGVARRRRLLSDSLVAADNNAIFELSGRISSMIASGLAKANHFGYESVEVQLNGLYILARSVSEDKRYYYSLAVCPARQ